MGKLSAQTVMLRNVVVSMSELEKEGKPPPYFVMLQKPRTRHAARSRSIQK